MRTLPVLLAALLCSCAGDPSSEEGDAPLGDQQLVMVKVGSEGIVWRAPTGPIANFDLFGLYPAAEGATQAMTTLSLGTCGYSAAWGDGTTSVGRYEALPLWDPSSGVWTSARGTLHLWVGENEQDFLYSIVGSTLEIIPTSTNAIAMHGTSGWRFAVPPFRGHRAACAWPKEDLTCVGMTAPPERAADCSDREVWQQLGEAPFRFVSTNQNLGYGRMSWELRIADGPELSSINCVEYLLPSSFAEPFRTVCDPGNGFAVGDFAYAPFSVITAAQGVDGRAWKGVQPIGGG